ncbi:transposase [Streptomyces sp. NPDC002012]|uniref:transposase n=1 Tax=Streptomyces sp. NPDC002012 TaxID=3154532 RepID=UPI00332CBF5A
MSSRRRICGGGRRRVCGLLGPVSRKNGWQLAEYAGWRRPDGQQHLLDRAKWDADELRDRVRRYALDGLANNGGGVLVIDETGFAKKGRGLGRRGSVVLRLARRCLPLPGRGVRCLGYHSRSTRVWARVVA